MDKNWGYRSVGAHVVPESFPSEYVGEEPSSVVHRNATFFIHLVEIDVITQFDQSNKRNIPFSHHYDRRQLSYSKASEDKWCEPLGYNDCVVHGETTYRVREDLICFAKDT